MSLFGAPSNPSGGGLFGSSTVNSTTTPLSTPGTGGLGGGGLFGASGTTQSTSNAANGGGGLFGSASTSQSAGLGGGGLFGSTAAKPALAAPLGGTNTLGGGGGLFGNTATTNTNSSGGLFGNKPTTSSISGGTGTGGGGLFGSTTQSTGGGLFGSTNTTASTQNTGMGLFGSTPANSSNISGRGSAFCSAQQNNNMMGGGGGGGLFSNAQGQQQQQQTQQLQLALHQQLQNHSQKHNQFNVKAAFMKLGQSYDPNSDHYKFQYFLYRNNPSQILNQPGVPPLQKGKRLQDTMPIPTTNSKDMSILWQQAKLNNPDPSTCIPDQIKGSQQGLMKRLEWQKEYCEKLDKALSGLETKLNMSSLKLKSDISEKILERKRELSAQIHRVLKVMCKLETFRSLNYPMNNLEDDMLTQLEDIKRLMSNPPYQYQARVTELRGAAKSLRGKAFPDSNGGTTPVDPGTVDKMEKFLKEQTDGLALIDEITKDDLLDLELMCQHIRHDGIPVS